MKNLLILLLLCFIYSCKKNRICNCTITTIGTTETTTTSQLLQIDTTIITPLNVTNVNKITLKKVSKRKANFNCFDKTEDLDETTTNNIPGFFSISSRDTGTRNYKCKLE